MARDGRRGAGVRFESIGYRQARQLLVLAGLAILAIITVVMYVRRVDSVEVAATLLFVPIFLGFLFFRAPGGLITAVGASAVYVILRLPSVEAVGFGEFAGLIVSRCAAYLVFGLLGGWSNQILEGSLEKLDIYDQIDDATGLFNARCFVQDTQLEATRAQRYETLFSVGLVQIPTGPLKGLGRRKTASALRELGRKLDESVRTVDRLSHAEHGGVHNFVAILPETSTEGAGVFTVRFADAVHGFLEERGVRMGREEIAHRTLTVPGDEAALRDLRDRFAEIEADQYANAG